jgi:nucleoside-diphosphate-sugar epimerase
VSVPRSVVVTGASGWLGQNLVRALAPDRERVRCLVRSPDECAALALVGSSVEVVRGDLRDPAAMDRLFDGLSGATVFHAASVIHPNGRTRELFDVNVGGTQMVLDRARRADSARFVHVSSNSPFGVNAAPTERFTEESAFDPYLAYGQSKMEAEQLVARSFERGDLATVVIRPPWFYGPFQPDRQTRFFAAVRRGRFPLVGDGTSRRSVVYTGNLVHGLLCAERTPAAAGRAYWIADPEPLEMRTIITTVADALEAEGLPVRRRAPIRIPVVAARTAAWLDGALQAGGRYVQALHVLGEMQYTIACDVSRARAELGYAPETNLLDGMRASVRWCLERGVQL